MYCLKCRKLEVSSIICYEDAAWNVIRKYILITVHEKHFYFAAFYAVRLVYLEIGMANLPFLQGCPHVIYITYGIHAPIQALPVKYTGKNLS